MNIFDCIRDSITRFEDFWNWCGIVFKDFESERKWNDGKNSNGGANQTRQPNQNQPSTDAACSPDFPPTITTDYSSGQKNKNGSNKIKLIFEWAAFLGGIGLLGLNYFQLREIRLTRIQDERAWVLTTGELARKNSADHKLTTVSVFFKNTGKTPALNMHCYARCTAIESLIPPKDDCPPNLAGMCAPGQPSQVAAGPWESYHFDDAFKGTPIFVYGTIWYDDIFGGHHWTQFGFKMIPSIDESIAYFIATEKHNTCDDAENAQK